MTKALSSDMQVAGTRGEGKPEIVFYLWAVPLWLSALLLNVQENKK